MSSSPVPSLLSPERRTALFYLSLFLTSGAATAYGGIWLNEMGLTEGQIGVINATPILFMLILSLVVGRLADKASDWRQTIVLCSVLSGIAAIGLLWSFTFWPILIFVSAVGIAHSSMVPVIDAAAMRMTRRRGTDFGTMRAWGTVGYLVLLVATGYLAEHFGPSVYVPLFVTLALIRAATAFILPRFRAPDSDKAPVGATKLLQVMKPWFVLPLFGFAILFASHLILNAFQGLLWQRQGIGVETIGILIALGALSETAMFFLFGKFAGRLPARVWLLISGLVTVCRWVAFGFEPGVPLLVGLQLLHGITYGLGFMACVNFISNWTAEDIAAEAQSFFVLLQQGMSVLSLTVFGLLIPIYGVHSYFFSAAFAALGVICVALSLRLQSPAT